MLHLTTLLALVGFTFTINSCDAMTMKQVKNTGKMMRKSCQPKFNVEDGLIDQLSDGVFADDKDLKCYMACVMKMANTIKNNKFHYDSAMKQSDLILPDDLKEPAKTAITACKKVPESYKDICDQAFHFTKCVYNENPSIFYFP